MILKFVNREKELDFLEKRYTSGSFEFIVIYGKRRIGKTELLKHFLKDKNGFYFLCDKRGTLGNFQRFKKQTADFLNELPIESNNPEDIFGNIREKTDGRLVIIMDEFSYLVEKDDSIPSVFQLVIDEVLKDGNIMLIISGSSMSMIEKGVLSYKSPLYGRKTGHWKVEELSFSESSRFFDNTMEKNFEFWSILGGVPFYLEKFSSRLNTFDNINKQIFSREGRLYEEVEFLLKEELREPDVYKAILEAMASGKTKIVDIANASNIKAHDIDKYLKVLQSLSIITRISPITESKKSKKSLYYITDKFFSFWFRFCEPNKSKIAISDIDEVNSILRKNFNLYLSRNFEDLCSSSISGYEKVGKWWGAKRVAGERKTEEIDIVALNEDKKEILFAECKWQSRVNPDKVLAELKEKSALVDWNKEARKEKFAIFAKSFYKKINEKDVILYDLKEIEKMMK